VPPVALAVKLTWLATEPVVGPLTVAARASGDMTIVAVAVAVAELESVTVSEIV